MVAIIEFDFRNEQITKYINTDDLFNNIKGDNNLIIDFVKNGVKYQFQVFWESSEIGVYLKGGTNPIYYINNFNLYFNRNLK